MPRGGARPNSGPARQVGSVRWRREQRAKRAALAKAPAVARKLPQPPIADVQIPTDLPAGQAAVWKMLAPHALAARTLTPATAWAFRDLCEAIVLKRDMLAVIEAEGLTSTSLKTLMDQSGGGEQVFEPKAHCLLARHAALMVRVEVGLTRFRLAPMGKEMPAAEEEADPFKQFSASAPKLRRVK